MKQEYSGKYTEKNPLSHSLYICKKKINNCFSSRTFYLNVSDHCIFEIVNFQFETQFHPLHQVYQKKTARKGTFDITSLCIFIC